MASLASEDPLTSAVIQDDMKYYGKKHVLINEVL